MVAPPYSFLVSHSNFLFILPIFYIKSSGKKKKRLYLKEQMLGQASSVMTGAGEGLEYSCRVLFKKKSHEMNIASFSFPQHFSTLTKIIQNFRLGTKQIT